MKLPLSETSKRIYLQHQKLRNNLPTCDNDATSLYKENFRLEMLIYRSFKIQFLQPGLLTWVKVIYNRRAV